jgi:GGDEF domain-containing protein
VVLLLLRDVLRVALETLRERSVTDKQSLAYTRKYLTRSIIQELVKKKEEPLAFGIISLQGIEDLADSLPERVTGHLMKGVVERLHDLLRGNDLIGRWNKLEFGVLLPSTLISCTKDLRTVDRGS